MATRCSSLPESLFPSVCCKTLGFLNENLITTLCFFHGDDIPVWPVICHLPAFPPTSFPPHGSLQPPPNVCRPLSRPGSPPLWQTSLLHIHYPLSHVKYHLKGQTVPASPFPRGECPSVLVSQPCCVHTLLGHSTANSSLPRSTGKFVMPSIPLFTSFTSVNYSAYNVTGSQ